MLQGFGGLDRLVNSIARPAAAAVGQTKAAAPGESPAASTLRMAGDSDATLGAGRTSSLSLDPAVTLEGIASTLSRIYSAQVA